MRTLRKNRSLWLKKPLSVRLFNQMTKQRGNVVLRNTIKKFRNAQNRLERSLSRFDESFQDKDAQLLAELPNLLKKTKADLVLWWYKRTRRHARKLSKSERHFVGMVFGRLRYNLRQAVEPFKESRERFQRSLDNWLCLDFKEKDAENLARLESTLQEAISKNRAWAKQRLLKRKIPWIMVAKAR